MTAIPYAGVGVALQTIDAFGTAPDVLAIARAAEQVGLDHVWVPDHLVFHRPILEALMTAAAVAGATEQIGIGFSVLNGVLRPPVWLAKQLMSLDALSRGRIVGVGVGAGGEYPPEFEAAGVPVTERGARLDAVLGELPELIAGRGPGLSPVPETPWPVLIGGRSSAALDRTARFGDAWMPMWMDASTVAAAYASLQEKAQAHGRPKPGLVYVCFVNVNDDIARGREEAAQMIQRQYGLAFEKVERWALVGSAAEVAVRLADYREAGATGFVLSPATPAPLTQIDGLAAVREALL